MSINFTPANREYLTVDILACTATFDENRLAFTITDEKTAHPKVRFRTTADFEDDILAGFPYGEWNDRIVFDSPAISTEDWEQCASLRSPLFSGGYALRREEAALICPAFAEADVALLTGSYENETGIFTVFGDGIFDDAGAMLLVIDQDLDNEKLVQTIEKISQQLPASYFYGFDLSRDTWRDIIVMPADASFTETGELVGGNSAIKKMLKEVAERHFGKERGFEYHCSRNTVAFTNAYVVDSCGNVIEPNRVSEKACGRGVTIKVKEWDDLRQTDAAMTCQTEMNGEIVLDIELVSGEPLEKLTVLQARQLCAICKRVEHWAFSSFQEYSLDKRQQFTPPRFPIEVLMRSM